MTTLTRSVAIALSAIATATYAGSPPTWWTSQNVLNGAAANDYAAVNLGQLKQIAYGAYNELEANAPGGAGPTLASLINGLTQPPAAGVARNDYAAANLGQLKAVAKPFYDRLAEIGYSGPPLTAGQPYPWSGSANPANDYALANIGQLKFLFSFVPALTAVPPAVASTVHVASTTPNFIRFGWPGATVAPGAFIAGYNIYRDGTLLTTVSAQSRSFTDTTVVAGSAYAYTIKAVDAQGQPLSAVTVSAAAPLSSNQGTFEVFTPAP